MERLNVTILAGGVGKRMGGELPKVLHKVKGEAMIVRLIKEVQKLNPEKIMVVVGKFYLLIKEEIDKNIEDKRIVYVMQPEALGTGHAVKCTLTELNDGVDNIILNGDVPMIKSETIKEIYEKYLKQKVELMITSIELENPQGNGRIIKDTAGFLKEIVEEKDCTAEQQKIKLVNCGIYISNSDVLKKYIPKISCENAQNEFYLTDLVKYYQHKQKIGLFQISSHKLMEIFNVNTKVQLQFVNDYSDYDYSDYFV